MNLNIRNCAAALALVLCWAGQAAAENAADLAARTVAKVGKIPVNALELEYKFQQKVPMMTSFHGGIKPERVAELRQESLDGLIERAYKVQYAIEEEISVDGELVEAEWQKLLSKNSSLAEFAKTPQGPKLRASVYLDLLAEKAERVAVDEKIAVSDEDVLRHYQDNKERFYRPKLFTASHILVRVDPASNAEERAERLTRAEELLKRAKDGEDFYNLAYYESDDRSKYVGGSLGSFHAGQTVAEFDQAIQGMQSGEIAGPIKTMYGYHIIRLDKVDDERQMEFDEVSASIRASLRKAQREELYNSWMDRLKAKYPVERFLE